MGVAEMSRVMLTLKVGNWENKLPSQYICKCLPLQLSSSGRSSL